MVAMMAQNRAHDLARYAFSPGETLLLDTNVWLYLYPAPSNPKRQPAASYSSAFKKMLSTGVTLIMDVLILSEYLNRYCRIEFDALHRDDFRSFKAFRMSTAFARAGKAAASNARSIIRHCVRGNHPFASIDLEAAFAAFESGNQDFNDDLIARSCLHHGWKLVTHDADFIHGGVDVLTANLKLVRACNT